MFSAPRIVLQLLKCVKLKVAEHSFQVPMPNSPLLFALAPVFCKVNYRSIYSRILTKVCAVVMATSLVKNKA